MNNPTFICHYQYNNKKYVLQGDKSIYLDAQCDINDDHIKVTLYPKCNVQLLDAYIDYDHNYNDGDKFFVNGYQSWSTSKECEKFDMQDGVFFPLRSKFLIEKTGLSTDFRICKNESKKGHFHSHCFTYIKTGKELLFVGSLNEKSGYTVFKTDMKKGGISIVKDVEGVKTDKEYPLFDLVILKGEYDEVFDKYFDLMGVKEPKIDHLAGYTSWYNYFANINEEIIMRDLDALDAAKEAINIYQIDDGFEPAVGDWTTPDKEKFPNGLVPIVEKIHSKNIMAGLWLAPFTVEEKSNVYKQHPDWVLTDKNNKPIVGSHWPGFVLDIYNPNVREHMKNFFDVVLNQWGFDMVKLDFLYSCALNPRDNKSRAEIMSDGVDLLRECCGDKLILGCGLPLGVSFGKVDACRTGCDVHHNYIGELGARLPINDECPSAQMSINNTIFRRCFNKRAFINDPDVFFMRDTNITFTDDQKTLLQLVNYIFGDVIFMSDDMGEYSQEKVELAKKLYGKSDCTVDDVDFNGKTNQFVIDITTVDGEKLQLKFNLKTGEGNQVEIMNKLLK